MMDFSRSRRKAASLGFGLVLIVTTVQMLLTVGCRRPGSAPSDVSIEESIAPQPVRAGTETITFQLTNAAHQPISGAHIQIEGDMNHPGMAPVFSDATETSQGSYKAMLNFNMGGDWVVLFHITLSDGRKIERQMDVKGVASN